LGFSSGWGFIGETIGEARSSCQQIARKAVPGLFVDSRLNARSEVYHASNWYYRRVRLSSEALIRWSAHPCPTKVAWSYGSPNMFAVTGITGQVGGAVARTLLDARVPVRAVMRDAAKGAAWKERGCEVAVADMNDAPALTSAFSGVGGVFALIPPIFDPAPGFPEVRAVIAAVTTAIEAVKPPRVVCLSTIGAQATQPNLLNQLGLVEKALGALSSSVCFLRAAWFMENAAWDVAPARDAGIVPSFLQPLEKPVPMVATADIGHLAAALLQETWTGCRIVELEGPRRITPNQIAATFAKILCRPVRMEAVPRDKWEGLFASQGMKNPTPRAQMLDGFNEGWIEFENGERGSRKGPTEIEPVLAQLVTLG
jgi:uncharacterized protein YbjT (DUF2867 family)